MIKHVLLSLLIVSGAFAQDKQLTRNLSQAKEAIFAGDKFEGKFAVLTAELTPDEVKGFTADAFSKSPDLFIGVLSRATQIGTTELRLSRPNVFFVETKLGVDGSIVSISQAFEEDGKSLYSDKSGKVLDASSPTEAIRRGASVAGALMVPLYSLFFAEDRATSIVSGAGQLLNVVVGNTLDDTRISLVFDYTTISIFVVGSDRRDRTDNLSFIVKMKPLDLEVLFAGLPDDKGRDPQMVEKLTAASSAGRSRLFIFAKLD